MKSLASRSAEAAFAAAALLLATGTASAQGATVFREVRLDLSGLPAGASEARRELGACLSQSLPLAFAGRVKPGVRGAPVLVVRPTSVWLAPPSSGSGNDFGGSSSHFEAVSPDSMEGEAIIGGNRIPLMVTTGAETPSLGAALQQANRRTTRLCQSFTYWLARKV
jgi:hypothetical protein